MVELQLKRMTVAEEEHRVGDEDGGLIGHPSRRLLFFEPLDLSPASGIDL